MAAVINPPVEETPYAQRHTVRRKPREVDPTVPAPIPSSVLPPGVVGDDPHGDIRLPQPAIAPVPTPAPKPAVIMKPTEPAVTPRPTPPWEVARRKRLEAWHKLRDLVLAGKADSIEAARTAEAAGCPMGELKRYFRAGWEVEQAQKTEVEASAIVRDTNGEAVLHDLEKVRTEAARDAASRMQRACEEQLKHLRASPHVNQSLVEKIGQMRDEAGVAKAAEEARATEALQRRTSIGQRRSAALDAQLEARRTISKIKSELPEIYGNASPTWLDVA
jgi:hypothetical protein